MDNTGDNAVNVELSQEVKEAFDKFAETAELAKDVTIAATELTLIDFKELLKISLRSLADEAGRAKTEISGFKEELLNNKKIVMFGATVGVVVGGLVAYGLYRARTPNEDEESENYQE